MFKLFIDDERFPVDDSFEIARNFDEATNMMLERGCPDVIYFDHDLGEELTGKDIANWMVTADLEGIIDIKQDIVVKIHSQNSIGGPAILNLLESYIKHKFS